MKVGHQENSHWRTFHTQRRPRIKVTVGKLRLAPNVYCWTVNYEELTYDYLHAVELQGNGDTIQEAFRKLRLEIAFHKNPKVKMVHERMVKNSQLKYKFDLVDEVENF